MSHQKEFDVCKTKNTVSSLFKSIKALMSRKACQVLVSFSDEAQNKHKTDR